MVCNTLLEVPLNTGELELLAPAGNFACLRAAVEAGADAIYFGVAGLNMRNHSANNFALDDIGEVAGLCAAAGVRCYLALNTLAFDSDIARAGEILARAKTAGVDAIIASDVAVMQLARQVELGVHLSTQLNISNSAALKFYAQFADVAVLARELDLGQVRAIADEIVAQQITGPAGKLVRIEMFCHGAMCMANSGRCFMSLHLYNKSANRGECLQACRRSFSAHDTETGDELLIDNEFVMSPKDLKTIHFLDEMVRAGVQVFKIEGRARSADYVSTVVGCYREALDALTGTAASGSAANGSVAASGHTPEQITNWDKRLAAVFNRGFWDGWYLGQKVGERTAFYNSQATKTKVLLGKCLNYYTNIAVAEFVLEGGGLAVDDEILIIGQTTGVYEATIEALVVDGQAVECAAKGSDVTFVTSKKIRRGDKLYKLMPR
jgi:putative protease